MTVAVDFSPRTREENQSRRVATIENLALNLNPAVEKEDTTDPQRQAGTRRVNKDKHG